MRSKDRYGLQWDDREELLPHLSQWADHNDKNSNKQISTLNLTTHHCRSQIAYITFFIEQLQHTFLSRAHETFPRINHIFGPKQVLTNLNVLLTIME